jgi:CRP-like cAMP-binding protein/CheY-like chemotaxis protein
VITAENGKTGVEMAIQQKPDLIVCDIMMPVLDGYGVFHLLSKHKETASIPFIFLTAKSEKVDFRKGMEMGADDYIAKPFDGVELLNAIEVRLKKSEAIKQQYSGPDALNDFLKDVQTADKVQLTSDDREIVEYNKKLFVYKEGQRARAMYHVVSGKIKISRSNDDGKEFITSIHTQGEYFGYTPILEDTFYKDNAQALEDSTLMLIPRHDFLQLMSGDMDTAQAFIKIITQNIVQKDDSLLNLAYNSLRKKVAFGLISLSEKYSLDNEHKTLNISRKNMAQSIGIATESLIRTLGDFKEEKLIDIKEGKVIVINETCLRNLPY